MKILKVFIDAMLWVIAFGIWTILIMILIIAQGG